LRNEAPADTINIAFGQLGNVDEGVMVEGRGFCDTAQAFDTSFVVMLEAVCSKGDTLF
jgi:hypothetical protein